MDYALYLKDLLRPVGVYDLESGIGAWEIESLGAAFDNADDETQTLETESVILSASGYGLENYEKILPYIPAYEDLETRRTAIIALLQINDGAFTVSALNRTLAGCGINAKVEETDEKYIVCVSFPDNNGVPYGFDEIKNRIEQILPCHIEAVYTFTYPTWSEIEALGTWGDIENRNMTWSDIEHYKP